MVTDKMTLNELINYFKRQIDQKRWKGRQLQVFQTNLDFLLCVAHKRHTNLSR